MNNTQQTPQTSGKLWRCALIAGLGGILFGNGSVSLVIHELKSSW